MADNPGASEEASGLFVVGLNNYLATENNSCIFGKNIISLPSNIFIEQNGYYN